MVTSAAAASRHGHGLASEEVAPHPGSGGVVLAVHLILGAAFAHGERPLAHEARAAGELESGGLQLDRVVGQLVEGEVLVQIRIEGVVYL